MAEVRVHAAFTVKDEGSFLTAAKAMIDATQVIMMLPWLYTMIDATQVMIGCFVKTEDLLRSKHISL